MLNSINQFVSLQPSLPSEWTAGQILHYATLVPLLIVFVIAAMIDWRVRKIPNWLTLSLLVGGLIRSVGTWSLGLSAFTPLDAGLGCLCGFAISVPLFVLGARGAGDAKLYIASGAWVGWTGVIALFLIEAVLGLIFVVGRASVRGQLPALLQNTGVLIASVLHVRRVGLDQAKSNGERFTVYGKIDAANPDAGTGRFGSIDRPLPHAVPFLAASLVAILVGKI